MRAVLRRADGDRGLPLPRWRRGCGWLGACGRWGVRGDMKGSSSALSVLMRINSLRVTLHSPMCKEFSFLSPHMRQRVPYWGVSPLSIGGSRNWEDGRSTGK
eukprot:scaffold1734_cov113-Isochrysis_galbana.AAC.1